eukprot:COSAG02_NODE_8253_length_2640_cov_8.817001_1_plen_26_part_10
MQLDNVYKLVCAKQADRQPIEIDWAT